MHFEIYVYSRIEVEMQMKRANAAMEYEFTRQGVDVNKEAIHSLQQKSQQEFLFHEIESR